MKALAPGKLMLSGEYAVLEGAVALVAAVDRHAVATMGAGSPLPPEAAAALAVANDEQLLKAVPPMIVDVRDLQHEGKKLGLGSSAAASVAVLAAALAHEGHDVDRERSRIARIARTAHRRVQGGGSGVDVLASAWGGILAVTLAADPDHEPRIEPVAWPQELALGVFWTGEPVRTSALLERVRAAARESPKAIASAMEEIATASSRFLDALRGRRAVAAVDAVYAHHLAMRRLGVAAGANIVTNAMEQLAARAEPLGIAVKPSGAGGGDIVVAIAQASSALDALEDRTHDLGIRRIAVGLDAEGVRVIEGGRE